MGPSAAFLGEVVERAQVAPLLEHLLGDSEELHEQEENTRPKESSDSSRRSFSAAMRMSGRLLDMCMTVFSPSTPSMKAIRAGRTRCHDFLIGTTVNLRRGAASGT